MAVVATGFFDGVHLGHRLVIDTLLRAARERGEQSVVVTFWPPPRTVLQKDARELRLLSSLAEKKDILRFNLFQVVAHIIAWGLIAPVLDIVMYAEPANKVFLQGLVGGVSNIVTTAIVGTLLCIAYAASRPRSGSLKEEK